MTYKQASGDKKEEKLSFDGLSLREENEQLRDQSKNAENYDTPKMVVINTDNGDLDLSGKQLKKKR